MASKIKTSSAYARTRNKVRDSIRNQRASADKIRRDQAVRALARAEKFDHKADRAMRTRQAILYNTATLATKVLNSFNVTADVIVAELRDPSWPVPVKAYTDFRRLNVEIDTKRVDLNNIDSVMEFISLVKGAIYHEGGHVLYTTPITQWSDFGSSLKVMTEEGNAINDALKNLSILRATKYGDAFTGRCWNIIEDQRMERAMVLASPAMARYFTTTALNVVINDQDPTLSWPYIAGRKYLPAPIYDAIHDDAMTRRDLARLVEPIRDAIHAYSTAQGIDGMIVAFIDFLDLMQQWGLLSEQNETYHTDARRSKRTSDVPNEGNEPQPISGGNKGNNKGAGNDEGNVQEGVAQSEPQHADLPKSTPLPGNGAGGTTSDVGDEVQKALSDLRDSFKLEAQVFVESVHNDLTGELRRDPTCKIMDAANRAKADSITKQIVGALEHLIDHTSPSWRFRQESGVLDPTSYMMREPGDTDYWSGLDEEGQQGYDLSVSVLLDTSYSMCGDTDSLSVCALAIRQACDYIDIPCTVSTYNTEYGVLYRHDENIIPTMIGPTGGTEPEPLLDKLDSQRLDKRRHLVFILTDGEWDSSVTTLAQWSSPGRYFVLVGLRIRNTDILTRKQPDAAVLIHSLEDLPVQFRKALSGFLA